MIPISHLRAPISPEYLQTTLFTALNYHVKYHQFKKNAKIKVITRTANQNEKKRKEKKSPQDLDLRRSRPTVVSCLKSCQL
jgi:hypothetical protein